MVDVDIHLEARLATGLEHDRAYLAFDLGLRLDAYRSGDHDVRNCLRTTICLSCFWLFQCLAAVSEEVRLEQLLTKDEQSTLGITTMSPEGKTAMRDALIRMYQQGYRAGQTVNKPVAVTVPSVIETQVDGEFSGWEGETIVKLINGQIWQQMEYHYEYHYAYMPKVLVYPSGGGFKMKIEGTEQAIGVQRLR